MVIGVLSGVIGVQIYNIEKSNKINKKALNKTIQAYNKEAVSGEMVMWKRRDLQVEFEKLANRKEAILETTFDYLLKEYKRIVKINWKKTDPIKKSISEIFEFEDNVLNSNVALAKKHYSTDEKIARFVISPLFINDVIDAKSSLIDAKKENKYADVILAQADLICEGIDQLILVTKLTDSTIKKLNVLLYDSINKVKVIIDKNGSNRQKYTESEMEIIMMTLNYASALKQLINETIIDPDGNVSSMVKDSINSGEMLINSI